jgi:hypothetical protein
MAYGDLPWDEAVPGETSITYTYFAAFRDMGIHRNLQDAARENGVSRRYLERLSHLYKWSARALSYDVYMDGKRREVNEHAILEMNARQADLGRQMQDRAWDALKQQNPRELSPNELARYIETGAKLERVARGEPESRTSTEVKGDGMSWADVRRSILSTRVDKKEEEPEETDGVPWEGWRLPDVGPHANEETGQKRQTQTDGQEEGPEEGLDGTKRRDMSAILDGTDNLDGERLTEEPASTVGSPA